MKIGKIMEIKKIMKNKFLDGNKNNMELFSANGIQGYMKSNNIKEKIMDKKTKKLIGQIFFFGLERFKGFKHEDWGEHKKFIGELIKARKAFVEVEKNF